ncbi:glutamate receptor 3.2-like protein [Tanacetum coccineum]|uniref:Glutamate receptor 3.2-like protein n=1 Tax=Tanacetum coccineum TaxID=301880 RepID=A0ABQ4WT35_9ASTR
MSMESRVILVHTSFNTGLMIFEIAKSLGMMKRGYVWIATAWLSAALDSAGIPPKNADTLHGVLTLRPHTPDSYKKKAFARRWKNLSNESIGLNPYGLYAYDTVWIIAHAIDKFLKEGGQISFSSDSRLSNKLYTGTKLSGLLVQMPKSSFNVIPSNISSSNQRLGSVVWPGNTKEKPRGWEFSNNGRRLRIGVPLRVGFKEIIMQDG